MKSKQATRFVSCTAIAVLLAGCALWRNCENPASEKFWADAQIVADGIKLVKLELNEPRLMKAFIMQVDTKTPGMRFTGTGKASNWGEQMPDVTNRVCLIDTRRQRTADFMLEQRAPIDQGGKGRDLVVAINTEPWGPWESPFNHKFGDVYSPMYSDGVRVSKRGYGRGAIFTVWKDGTLDITREIPESRTNDVWVSATGFSIIMTNSVDIANPADRALAPRTAFGLSKNHRYLYLLAVDGRQKEYSQGADMHDLCDLMLKAGASDAMNMDGGGSTTMVYWDAETQKPKVCNRHDKNGYTRPVAANFGIFFIK